MQKTISRWFLFGLLLGWALTHATVFAQSGKSQDAKPTAVDKIRQGLDKSITIDFTGQSLVDVLNHFKDKTGLPINVDPMILIQGGIGVFPMPGGDPNGVQVTMKGTNEKAGQILRRTLNAHRLSYVILEDGLLITSEDQAVARQMRQRVSVDLDEVPLKKAARELARNYGINLIIDPKVAKQADMPVSLQLDNTGIETTLRLIAEMANLKAVRMGNVMFITTEEKAKKIREEEDHQFDNPMNPRMPNMPFGLPGAAAGLGGFGGFGGIAPVPLPMRRGIAPPALQIAPDLPAPGVGPAPPVNPAPAPVKKGGTAPVPPPPPPPPGTQRPDVPVAPPPPPVRP
jgi:hypothetical protein